MKGSVTRSPNKVTVTRGSQSQGQSQEGHSHKRVTVTRGPQSQEDHNALLLSQKSHLRISPKRVNEVHFFKISCNYFYLCIVIRQ